MSILHKDKILAVSCYKVSIQFGKIYLKECIIISNNHDSLKKKIKMSSR